MAKRRILKKNIGYITGELFTEVLVLQILLPNVDNDKAEKLMVRILDTQDEFICRAGNVDAKGNKTLVKEYYRKLKVDFQTEMNAIIADLEALGKEQA